MERTVAMGRSSIRRVSRLRWPPAADTSKRSLGITGVVAMCANIECSVRRWSPEWDKRLREELLNKEGVTQYVD
jgi:hypothetical protein